jgi:hypothetical protein
MTSPSGKPAPTQALIDTKRAFIQTLLRVNGDPSAIVASLSFSTVAGEDTLIVEGTTDDMDSLKEAADAAEAAGIPSFAGWITSGGPKFPDAAADPELTDSQKAGRRRSSSKRVRKVTRRRRHRKGSRKLRSKLL